MRLTHTVTLVEILWTAFCLTGLVYNIRLLYHSVIDLAVARIAGDQAAKYATQTTAIAYLLTSIVQFMFVTVGVIAMAIPATGGRISPLSYVITVAFITVSLLLTLGSWWNDNARQKTLEILKEAE